jgi:hypothetical protein
VQYIGLVVNDYSSETELHLIFRIIKSEVLEHRNYLIHWKPTKFVCEIRAFIRLIFFSLQTIAKMILTRNKSKYCEAVGIAIGIQNDKVF